MGGWKGEGASLRHQQPGPLPQALYFTGLCSGLLWLASLLSAPCTPRARSPKAISAMHPRSSCPHLLEHASSTRTQPEQPGPTSIVFPWSSPPESGPHFQFVTLASWGALKEAVY